MPHTIVVSTMEKHMTSEETVTQLHTKVERLLKQGWTTYGEILYWPNAVSQVMISDPIDMEIAVPIIEAAIRGGSTTPNKLFWSFGGRGHMGEKHWYD